MIYHLEERYNRKMVQMSRGQTEVLLTAARADRGLGRLLHVRRRVSREHRLSLFTCGAGVEND